MKRILPFLLALAAIGCSTASQTSPILSIEGGKVQGVTTDIPGIYVYRGIPYAAPPIRELRWKEPQPVIPWEGVMIADRFGHPGYQSVHYPGGYTTEWGYGDEAPYSEDCLYLNVWTKAPGEVDRKLPVAFWIHGGGYREGWGSEPEFDGQEWADKDVVLVSINYRLGVFGFLTHPELSAESPHKVSGNYGILDQIAALKWVKENIAQFGGDPDNVTIFGQSAGGGAVKTLCASPLTEGLFNKAVIMSAGGISRQATGRVAGGLKDTEASDKKILDWAGLDDITKMRAASTEMLYSLGSIYSAVNKTRAGLTSAPVVDGYVSTCSFDEAAYGNTLPHIPYMIGYTLNDMGDQSGSIADFCLNREQAGDVAYAYEFARPLPTDGRDNVLKGAFHSSDLWYVFKSLKHCWRPWTDGDWALSEVMLSSWSNFVKTGDPNGAGARAWSPYTRDNGNFMLFKLDSADREASGMGAPIAK